MSEEPRWLCTQPPLGSCHRAGTGELLSVRPIPSSARACAWCGEQLGEKAAGGLFLPGSSSGPVLSPGWSSVLFVGLQKCPWASRLLGFSYPGDTENV